MPEPNAQEIEKILRSKNLYEILGISENFSSEDLKKNYKKVK